MVEKFSPKNCVLWGEKDGFEVWKEKDGFEVWKEKDGFEFWKEKVQYSVGWIPQSDTIILKVLYQLYTIRW
jgi:hypothetical protein